MDVNLQLESTLFEELEDKLNLSCITNFGDLKTVDDSFECKTDERLGVSFTL
jgi:hypothetical protein